ncbi:hypothetical protein [Bacteroides neonati]|uniref:hypothetical protein n=1 Tax=Bacteroides neonati TaxID=1347393 RepID=UPI0005A8FAF2|nr:hypothetical protein [Bacteroides neonati]
MEDKKVQVVIELDKECVLSTLFLMGEKLSDEMWQKLVAESVVINDSDMGDQTRDMKIAFSCLALAKVMGAKDE